jgi:hypothetical protein
VQSLLPVVLDLAQACAGIRAQASAVTKVAGAVKAFKRKDMGALQKQTVRVKNARIEHCPSRISVLYPLLPLMFRSTTCVAWVAPISLFDTAFCMPVTRQGA